MAHGKGRHGAERFPTGLARAQVPGVCDRNPVVERRRDGRDGGNQKRKSFLTMMHQLRGSNTSHGGIYLVKFKADTNLAFN